MTAYKLDSADVVTGVADGVRSHLESHAIGYELSYLIGIDARNALSVAGTEVALEVGETLKAWLDSNRDDIVKAIAAQLADTHSRQENVR